MFFLPKQPGARPSPSPVPQGGTHFGNSSARRRAFLGSIARLKLSPPIVKGNLSTGKRGADLAAQRSTACVLGAGKSRGPWMTGPRYLAGSDKMQVVQPVPLCGMPLARHTGIVAQSPAHSLAHGEPKGAVASMLRPRQELRSGRPGVRFPSVAARPKWRPGRDPDCSPDSGLAGNPGSR